jgi:hypothetical protein
MSATPMPIHLKGVVFAYDDKARALICVQQGLGFSLPWLQKAGWKVTHEGLTKLPLLEPRVQSLHSSGAPLRVGGKAR